MCPPPPLNKLSLLCFTHPGLGELALSEVKGLCRGSKPSIQEQGIIAVELPKPQDVVAVCYGSRLFERVVLELCRQDLEDFSQQYLAILHKLVEKANLSSWLSGKTFKVSCIRSNVLSAQPDDWPLTQELAGEAGAAILSRCLDTKVKLEEPDVVVQLVLLKEEIVLSLDLCGFDLGKRDYRVFEHSRSVKATVGAAVFYLAGWKSGKTFVDPHGRGGILVIEAALAASKQPVHYFQKDKFLLRRLGGPFTHTLIQKMMSALDKKAAKLKDTLYYQDPSQRFVAAAKKNAKIAGVDKSIKFSRTEVSWLDIRFEKKQVDVIMTQAPTPGKSNSRKEVEAMLTEHFYQADYVLKKAGAMVLICSDALLAYPGAKKHGFVLEQELPIYQGMLPLTLQRWVRKKKAR